MRTRRIDMGAVIATILAASAATLSMAAGRMVGRRDDAICTAVVAAMALATACTAGAMAASPGIQKDARP
jgi:hypothetical protein